MEKILSARRSANGCKSGSRFVFDPTMGALIVQADLRLKIREAIRREVCRMKLHLYLTQARLYFELLCLKMRHAPLSVCGQFSGYF